MRYVGFVLALVALPGPAYGASCALSVGATFTQGGDTQVASAGCSVLHWVEIAAHYIGERQDTAAYLDNGIQYRFVADAHLALSATALWTSKLGAFNVHVGAGLWLKEDDRYGRTVQACEQGALPIHCINPWTPSPVSVFLPVGIEWRSWRLRYAHVSNAGSERVNLGQDTLQLGYVFNW